MSDPVTNVAIEDVLSSIRRLVSEDARVRPLTAKADESRADEVSAPELAAQIPGKLVLTPALRVADTDSDPEPAAGSVPAFAHDSMHDDATGPQDAGAQAEGEQQPATPDDLAHTSGAVLREEGVSIKDIASDATLASISEALAWEDHHADDHDRADHHQDEVADVSPAAPYDDAPAVDTSDGLDAVMMPSETDSPQQEKTEDTGDFVFATTREGGAVDQAAEDAFTPVDAASDASHFDISGHDLDGPESLFSDDDTILDEEMLRELVTDIVRQELQGALGERITRNVRKLVRREIHRALASHDLE